jgi:hypothetical protein
MKSDGARGEKVGSNEKSRDSNRKEINETSKEKSDRIRLFEVACLGNMRMVENPDTFFFGCLTDFFSIRISAFFNGYGSLRSLWTLVIIICKFD